MPTPSRLLTWGLMASVVLPLSLSSQERVKRPDAPSPAASSRAGARRAALANSQVALQRAKAALQRLRAAGQSGVEVDALRSAVVDLTAACAALQPRRGKIADAAPPPKRLSPESKPLDVSKLAAARKPLDANKLRLSLDRGLRWLQTHQDPDGRWDSDNFFKHDPKDSRSTGAGKAVHDVGVTALAMMALVADGNTTNKGPYKDAVLRASVWLSKQQGENGLVGTNASHDFIYDHALAAVALCELVRKEADRGSRLRRNAQRAINYLESHRNPYGCWRYQPRDNDNDTSVTSWCVHAYLAGKAAGLEVNPQALQIAAQWFDQVTDPNTGRVGYSKRGEPSSRHAGNHSKRFPVTKGEALTAAGLAARVRLGGKLKPGTKRSVERILRKLPLPDDRSARDHYYWFYGTDALAGVGGDAWKLWARAAGAALMTRQVGKGSAAGSWDSESVWGEDGGRIYTTSLALMGLHSIWSDAMENR